MYPVLIVSAASFSGAEFRIGYSCMLNTYRIRMHTSDARGIAQHIPNERWRPGTDQRLV